MSRYAVTPWRTHSDLLAVREQLFPNNNNANANSTEDQRSLAVSRIMAWKLRGNLPHAVESTALLTDAILHHDLTTNSIFSVRAVYAAAFTRFVTGFCDIGRNRERMLEPSSMLEIARQIDMPDEFVALRHEATHEDLPSVQRLVAVCGQALDWLWRVYWSRLAEEPVVVAKAEEVVKVDVAKVKDEGRALLKEFRSARKQSLKGKGGSTPQNQGDAVKETAGDCATLCRNDESAIIALTRILLGDKMLYPSDRGLGASMNGAYLLWDGLLQAMTKKQRSFLPVLLKGMHGAMNLSSAYHHILHDPEKEALHQWMLHIATSDVWSQARRSVGTNVEGDLMTLCCLHPSPWSHSLGNALLDAGDEVFVESWSDLLSASAMAESMDVEDTGDQLPDVDMGEPQETTNSVAGSDCQTEAAGEMPSWREALAVPRVPIGAV